MDKQFFIDVAEEAKRRMPANDPRFPPSVYYRFLQVLAKRMKPKLSVELGVCGGGGSFHLCIGHKQGQVVGVELSNEYPDNMEFIKCTCPNFYLWRGDSVSAAPAINEEYGAIDILFIDTIHTYEHTVKEYTAYKRFMSPNGVIILDDLNREGMDAAWAYIPGNKVRLDEMHIGGSPTDGGFGVIF